MIFGGPLDTGSGNNSLTLGFNDAASHARLWGKLDDCVVLAVPQRALRDKLHKDQGFAARFYRALAIFLANRMRATMNTLGYGKPPEGAR